MKFGRKDKTRPVDLDKLHPKIAAGITQGDEPVAAPVKTDEQVVEQHLGGKQKTLGRLPVFRALLRDDITSVWQDGQTDRLQRNVLAVLDKETFNSIQAGHMCLRCYEPQPEAFPVFCDLCGYPVQERQILDVAMEFKGTEHVGPAKPFAEYLAEQDERIEKAKFEQKIREGGSKGRRRG